MKLLSFEEAFQSWVAERGMGWDRFRFAWKEGGEQTQAYRLTPPDRPRCAVIALHGAGNDALFAWVGLFKRLLLTGAQILTFDLPGHGRASATRFAERDACEALTAALDHVAISHRQPTHAIGVSLGGSVLLRTLPSLGERLASATLVVAPLRIHLSGRSLRGELRPRIVQTLWREREHYGATGLIPSFGPFRRDVYPLRLAAPPPAGAFGYVDALNRMLTEMDLEEAASRITVPSLLVYGERDRIVPVEQGERIHARISGSELLRVPGGTHLSTPLEPVVADRIVSWIEEHS
jgi:3-oxoadipate enol-lactonase